MYFCPQKYIISAIFITLQSEFYRVMTFRKIIKKLSNRYVIATVVFLLMVTEDKEGMERIAREKYFMKRDNEVVYKIKGKE